jgi:hypothetical protein
MAGTNKPEKMNAKQGLLKISKKMFVRALRESPRSAQGNNRWLRDLVIRFRYELGNCTDEIPCNLERFGFHRGTTFAYFINEVIWNHL